jgi:hypothetical protein
MKNEPVNQPKKAKISKEPKKSTPTPTQNLNK